MKVILFRLCTVALLLRCSLSKAYLNDHNNTILLNLAHELLSGSFNAGDGYPQVWARDFGTFVELALDVNPPETIRNILLGFFCRQKSNGEAPGGFTYSESNKHNKTNPCVGIPSLSSDYRYQACDAFNLDGVCKNDCETDQETSLILAVHKYVGKTKDSKFLSVVVNGFTILERLEMSLQWLQRNRTAPEPYSPLLWGGTTLDWGDVQAEQGLLWKWWCWYWNGKVHIPNVSMLNLCSHPSIDVYDNSMFVMALDAFTNMIQMQNPSESNIKSYYRKRKWLTLAQQVRNGIRKHLWIPVAYRFRTHIYLDTYSTKIVAVQAGLPSFVAGSPFSKENFPPGKNEDFINYHGAAASASLAGGILSRAEVKKVLAQQFRDIDQVTNDGGTATVGLTMYPVYANMGGTIKPYVYQNAGDWAWFGGRMVSALVKYNLIEEARKALKPMVDRVVEHGMFYEWWSVLNGQPKGSKNFRGSAGVLTKAIRDLQAANITLMVFKSESVADIE